MSLKKALLVACLLLLPGVVLRVVPYWDRIAARVRVSGEPGHSEAGETVAAGKPTSVPSRLSQRPLALVVLGFAFEVSLYLILIATLLRSRRLMRLFEPAAPVAKAAGMLFLTVLFAGFLGATDASFPIMPWRMYSGQPGGTPDVCLLDGLTRGGETVRFAADEVLPMMRRHRAYTMMCQRVSAADGVADTSPEHSELGVALLAVARLYNLRHLDDPLARLSVSRAAIPVDNTSPPWLRDVRVIATVEVE